MIRAAIKIPANLKLLTHKSALCCLKAEKAILKILRDIKNLHFIITLSGGADSTALAYIFYFLAPRHDLKLSICHINHHLRQDADNDEAFAKELARILGIPFYLSHLDINKITRENNCGIEEAARIGRYSAFEKLRGEIHADFILTAHHSGDLGEDVLMRLARGSGWPALGGMRRSKGFILRPLLYFSKKQLQNFLLSFGQSWREDCSNSSTIFTRNRFRHEIMPLFLRENPAYEQNICELNELATLEEEYWKQKLAEKLALYPCIEKREEDRASILLPSNLLDSLHPAERLRLYMAGLKRLGLVTGQKSGARARTLLKLDRAYELKLGGKIFQFSGKTQASIVKGSILLSAIYLDK